MVERLQPIGFVITMRRCLRVVVEDDACPVGRRDTNSHREKSIRRREKSIRRRVSVDCRTTSDYGQGHSNVPRRSCFTETKTGDAHGGADLTAFTSEGCETMRSQGLRSKTAFNLADPCLIRRKRSELKCRSGGEKIPTLSKLLSKFLHLDDNIRQNDAAVD